MVRHPETWAGCFLALVAGIIIRLSLNSKPPKDSDDEVTHYWDEWPRENERRSK